MLTRPLRNTVVAALAAGALVLVPAAVAGAHHPTIEAEVVCVDGAEVVAYTSTAWSGQGADPTNDPSRQNDQVDISFDGAVVGSGAYAPRAPRSPARHPCRPVRTPVSWSRSVPRPSPIWATGTPAARSPRSG